MQEIVDRPEIVAEWQANIRPPLSFEHYVGELETLYFEGDLSPERGESSMPAGLLTTHDGPAAVAWEGEIFIYHSLAHVNRQVCIELLDRADIDVTVVPTVDPFFDPRGIPRYKKLIEAHRHATSRPPQVAVRHQWPPNFMAPPAGNWVMIQPWEFGGIPADWVVPIRDASSPWVRPASVRSRNTNSRNSEIRASSS